MDLPNDRGDVAAAQAVKAEQCRRIGGAVDLLGGGNALAKDGRAYAADDATVIVGTAVGWTTT